MTLCFDALLRTQTKSYYQPLFIAFQPEMQNSYSTPHTLLHNKPTEDSDAKSDEVAEQLLENALFHMDMISSLLLITDDTDTSRSTTAYNIYPPSSKLSIARSDSGIFAAACPPSPIHLSKVVETTASSQSTRRKLPVRLANPVWPKFVRRKVRMNDLRGAYLAGEIHEVVTKVVAPTVSFDTTATGPGQTTWESDVRNTSAGGGQAKLPPPAVSSGKPCPPTPKCTLPLLYRSKKFRSVDPLLQSTFTRSKEMTYLHRSWSSQH